MKKLPSIKQLQYLLALHEYQHFGKTAEACFISQSTLSASILNLEETLNAQLLERDHKTFIFTPLGEEVVKEAQEILFRLNELTDYANNEGLPMKGIVRLGCIPTIAPFVLSEIVELSRKQFPHLTLLLREDTTDKLLQALNTGHIDILLFALPYEATSFCTKILAHDAFKLVLHRNWTNREFTKDISAWPDESIFLLEQEHCLTKHALQACELQDTHKINPFRATTLHTLTQMVNSQLGVTFLPQMAINSGILTRTELICQQPHAKHAFREIGIAWRPTSRKQQTYHQLAELIKAVLIVKCKLS